MKKILLIVVWCLSVCSLEAQTYTSGHLSVSPTDSMWHDSTICMSQCITNYSITIDSSFVGDSVMIVDSTYSFLLGVYYNSTGISPWSFMHINDNVNFDDITVGSGYCHFIYAPRKITHQSDTLYITPHDSLVVLNPCSYSTVSGHIYKDNNGNCVFDSGDVGLNIYPGFYSHFSSSVGSYIGEGIGWGGGWYSVNAQQSWMTDYSVYLPSYYLFIFPPTPCFADSFTFTSLPQTNIDFPLLCSSSVDLQCAVLSPGNVRLHRPFYIQPYVSNTGCDTISGQLTLIKDSRVTYDSAMSTNLPVYVHGDTLVWNYSSLTSIANEAYWNSFLSDIYLSPDSTLVVGDTLCFHVYTGVPVTDVNPANNDYSVCLPVVYSFDPNEKDVSPKGAGPEGYISSSDTLTYTLHFQNTGSDMAYDIHIIDTLDSHLNANSFRILGTSHYMTPKWLALNIVEFDFNNIFLPDSFSNEPASHGSVRFSIAPDAGTLPGSQIRNTGYIYFDANPPVVTNTTLNTISGGTLNIHETSKNTKVRIYPNPATDNITVEGLADGTLSIININGVVVLEQNIANNKTTIDVSKMANGIYFLKVVNNENTATTKFIKY